MSLAQECAQTQLSVLIYYYHHYVFDKSLLLRTKDALRYQGFILSQNLAEEGPDSKHCDQPAETPRRGHMIGPSQTTRTVE